MARSQVPIVDFHSHILPFTDHGSASLDMSGDMILQAKKAGVATIVATPHFYSSKETVEDFLQRRNAAYLEMKDYFAKKHSLDMPIIPGAEVALEKEIINVKDPQSLCIGNTKYIMMEMPKNGRFYSWMYDYLYHLESHHGLRVILAHVDRYSVDAIQKLLDLGFCAQVNADSLISGKNRKLLRAYCEEGLIELVGSDAHDDKLRCYRPLITLQKKLSGELLTYFYNNSLEILTK